MCIFKLALSTESGKPFRCPLCRHEAPLPEGGVDNLKTGFFADRLKSTVIALLRAHSKAKLKSELGTVSSNTEIMSKHLTQWVSKDRLATYCCCTKHISSLFLTAQLILLNITTIMINEGDDGEKSRIQPLSLKGADTDKAKSIQSEDYPLLPASLKEGEHYLL